MEIVLVVNIWRCFEKSWGGIDILNANVPIHLYVNSTHLNIYLATTVHSAF